MELPKNNKELDEYLKNDDLTLEERQEAIFNLFRVADDKKRIEHEDLKRFSKQNALLSSKEKSYKFIEYYYDNYANTFAEYELLVLLISRGKDFNEYQEEIYNNWKFKAQKKLNESGFSSSNDKGETKNFSYAEKYNLESTDVSKVSTLFIPNFWGGSRNEYYTLEATMMRIADWGKIHGFEGYWERIGKDIHYNAPDGVDNKFEKLQELYTLCRSDYSIKLFKNKLSILLDVLAMPDELEANYPWEYAYYEKENFARKIGVSSFFAASQIFSIIRLGKRNDYEKLLKDAVEFLVKSQSDLGGWKAFSTRSTASIETTALCIHALALYDYDKYLYIIKIAVRWLYNQQDIWGLWFEDDNPYNSTEFLSVLVLDAIEISEGNFDKITFIFDVNRKMNKKAEDIKSPVKNIYHIGKIEGANILLGEQSVVNAKADSPIQGKDSKVDTNKYWWVTRILISIVAGLVGGYFVSSISSISYFNSGLAITSILLGFLLLRNPRRRFYRAAWYCLGLFGVINILPVIDLKFKTDSVGLDGIVNKTFELGIQDEPFISIVLIILAGYLFYLDSKK